MADYRLQESTIDNTSLVDYTIKLDSLPTTDYLKVPKEPNILPVREKKML